MECLLSVDVVMQSFLFLLPVLVDDKAFRQDLDTVVGQPFFGFGAGKAQEHGECRFISAFGSVLCEPVFLDVFRDVDIPAVETEVRAGVGETELFDVVVERRGAFVVNKGMIVPPLLSVPVSGRR